MHIKSLRVSQFRNLESQTIVFPQKCTLVCGENGQGKTSVLEAIYSAAHARSFRTSRLRELIAWDTKQTSIELEIDTTDGVKDLSCEISPGKKKICVNGNPVEKASAYYGQITCIAFTPESMQLVRGGPKVRRKFIDHSQSMLKPLFVDTLVQYQRALRSRNTILSENRSSIVDGSVSGDVLAQIEIWESLIGKYGAQIITERISFIKQIETGLFEYYKRISGDREKIHLEYSSSLLKSADFDDSLDNLNVNRLEDLLFEQLKLRRRDDAFRQQTSIGPHRDELDISVSFGASRKQAARQSASQGQSRSIALALSLAVVELVARQRQEPPVVLLDDVESELDAARRLALFEVLSEVKSQAIITATEPSAALLEASKNPNILTVCAGKISSETP